MKYISKDKTMVHKNSERCVATEYPTGDGDIDMATVEISGRYPDEGRVINRISKEICFVCKGGGKVVIEGKEIILHEGDVVQIDANEKYYWDGIMSLVISCTPAWTLEQHKKVE